MEEMTYDEMMKNLPDNSSKAKAARRESATKEAAQPEKRASKVIAGKAVQKPNKGRKFKDMFLAENADDLGGWLISEILVPAIKKTVYDMIMGGLDYSLFGERRNRRSGVDSVRYRDYNSISSGSDRFAESSDRGTRFKFDDIYVNTRDDAERVLTQLDDMMETYNQVRVADLYETVGITGDYTDNNYGWTDIRDAKYIRTKDGYKIQMPKPRPIRR